MHKGIPIAIVGITLTCRDALCCCSGKHVALCCCRLHLPLPVSLHLTHNRSLASAHATIACSSLSVGRTLGKSAVGKSSSRGNTSYTLWFVYDATQILSHNQEEIKNVIILIGNVRCFVLKQLTSVTSFAQVHLCT